MIPRKSWLGVRSPPPFRLSSFMRSLAPVECFRITSHFQGILFLPHDSFPSPSIFMPLPSCPLPFPRVPRFLSSLLLLSLIYFLPVLLYLPFLFLFSLFPPNVSIYMYLFPSLPLTSSLSFSPLLSSLPDEAFVRSGFCRQINVFSTSSSCFASLG